MDINIYSTNIYSLNVLLKHTVQNKYIPEEHNHYSFYCQLLIPLELFFYINTQLKYIHVYNHTCKNSFA